MKYLSILVVLFFLSCSKDNDGCRVYELITESNAKEADLKCDGLANSYPRFDIVNRVSLGCLNAEQLADARRQTTSNTREMCSGVTFTVRTRIN
jgi:hypothetical protein